MKKVSKPSDALKAHNRQARKNKSVLSANYDLAEMRTIIVANSPPPSNAQIESYGQFQVEVRGNRDGKGMVIFVPGGGFFLPPNEQHRVFIDRLADLLGMPAAIVHHRLSPEHKFPAAFEDTSAALDRLIGNGSGGPFFLIADSSGAALAISAMISRHMTGSPNPSRCVFMSALTDMAMTGLSHVSNSESDPMFGPEAIIHKSINYLAGENPTDWRASPLWGDLSGLPPMLLTAGSTEVMLDDTLRLAKKATSQGCEIQTCVIEEAPHSFAYISDLPEADAVLNTIVQFLRAG